MRLTLVLPPFDLINAYSVGTGIKRGNLPPLGVGYLAAAAVKAGHAVNFVDPAIKGLDVARTAAEVLGQCPDVVGISCTTKLAGPAYALAEAVKQAAPAVKVIMGGPHVTSFYDKVLRECASLDVVVPGEGELVLPKLLTALERGTPLGDIQGIIYTDAGGVIHTTEKAPVITNLDEMASPLRSIYQQEAYIPLPNQYRRLPSTTIITARGCSYGKCKFCYQGGEYAPTYRRRSPENVVEEVKELVRDYGIRELIFWDDNFCINYSWIKRFCDLLDEARIRITWTAQARVNSVSLEMLQRMAASGCYSVYYGLESGSQFLLDSVQKGTNLDQARQAVRWARKAGMEIRASVIFGLPHDTPELAEQTLRFVCELNVDWLIFYPYHVKAGTALAAIAAQEGVILEVEEDDMMRPSYVPKGYRDAEHLAETVKSAYRRYYLRPRYILRTLWKMRDPRRWVNYWYAFLYWRSYTAT
jgi:radical SAM superfamily enzyme YgiQ (UPF0313 family)